MGGFSVFGVSSKITATEIFHLSYTDKHDTNKRESLVFCVRIIYATCAQWMFQNFCEVSADFPGLLRRLRDPLQLRASQVVVQFPFVMPVTEEKTEEELARITERRKEQGKKLQEIAANKRMEKVSSEFVYALQLYT